MKFPMTFPQFYKFELIKQQNSSLIKIRSRTTIKLPQKLLIKNIFMRKLCVVYKHCIAAKKKIFSE